MADTCCETKNLENNVLVKDNAEQQQCSNYFVQILCAIAVSLEFGMIGIHFGWSSPTLPILTNSTITPIPTTSAQAGWIASFLQIGGIFGPVLAFYVTDTFGRKNAILLATIPNFLSFLIIYLATNVWHLYLARFICGLSVGLGFVAVPIYITEISSPQIRGALGTLPVIFMGVGQLIEYILVPYTLFRTNALICLVIALLIGITIVFIPISPYFYVIKGKNSNAAETLRLLRRHESINNELDILKQSWEQEQLETKDSNLFDIFTVPLNRKCLIIVSGLILSQQFSGSPALISYVMTILKDAQAPISSNLSGILIVILLTLFPLFATAFVDRFGRKALFIGSCILAAIPLVFLALFYFLKSFNFSQLNKLTLIPLLSIIAYFFAFCLGLGTLPYVISSELFPVKYKSIAATFISILGSIAGFSVIKCYQIISDSIGVQYNFCLFTLFCILSTLFCYKYLPETKGKSLEQIQMDLKASISQNKIAPNPPS